MNDVNNIFNYFTVSSFWRPSDLPTTRRLVPSRFTHLHSQLGSLDGGDITTGTGTDHHQVSVVRRRVEPTVERSENGSMIAQTSGRIALQQMGTQNKHRRLSTCVVAAIRYKTPNPFAIARTFAQILFNLSTYFCLVCLLLHNRFCSAPTSDFDWDVTNLGSQVHQMPNVALHIFTGKGITRRQQQEQSGPGNNALSKTKTGRISSSRSEQKE